MLHTLKKALWKSFQDRYPKSAKKSDFNFLLETYEFIYNKEFQSINEFNNHVDLLENLGKENSNDSYISI